MTDSGHRRPVVPARERLAARVRSAVRLVRSSDLAISYAGIVIVIAVILSLVSRSTHHRIVNESSTNLVNLRDHPLWVLLASAFVSRAWWACGR